MTPLPANRGPRFVFITDTRAPAATGRFGWQLDAANNRPLGRGVGTHASLDSCRRGLEALRSAPGGLVDVVTFDAVRGVWTWRVDRDGAACVLAVRTYLRRFECRRAATLFRSALTEAAVDTGVLRVVRPEVLARYDLGAPVTGTAAAS